MIEKWEDLDIKDEEIEKGKFEEVIGAKVQEKLGVSLESLREKLSLYVAEHAETLAEDFANIAPLGKYDQLIEDRSGIINFLRTEAHKVEHWKLHRLELSEASPNLLVFEFSNASVDEGDVCAGFAYVSFSGKIRHAFAQGDV